MLYGGRSNNVLSDMIFDYIGHGRRNHIVTFSEFMYFVRELQLRRQHQMQLIFKMITDRSQKLNILQLLKKYL